MAITLAELKSNTINGEPQLYEVYVDVDNFDDTDIMLKQNDDWIQLDGKQQSSLRDFLNKRLTEKD